MSPDTSIVRASVMSGGSVTDIRTLEHRIATLQAQVRTLSRTLATVQSALTDGLIAVNAKTQRTGATIGPLTANSTTDVPITWPTEWPDTAYAVEIELLTGTAALGNLHATLKAGTKTTTGATITVSASAAVATVGVDVVGIRT